MKNLLEDPYIPVTIEKFDFALFSEPEERDFFDTFAAVIENPARVVTTFPERISDLGTENDDSLIGTD